MVGQDVLHFFSCQAQGVLLATLDPDRIGFLIGYLREVVLGTHEFPGVWCAQEVTWYRSDLVDEIDSHRLIVHIDSLQELTHPAGNIVIQNGERRTVDQLGTGAALKDMNISAGQCGDQGTHGFLIAALEVNFLRQACEPCTGAGGNLITPQDLVHHGGSHGIDRRSKEGASPAHIHGFQAVLNRNGAARFD